MHHAVSFVAAFRLPFLAFCSLAAGAAAQQQLERYNLRDLLGDERGAAVEQSFQRGTLKELLQGMPGGVSPATNVQRGMLLLRVAGEQQKWMGDALQLLARDKELEVRVQLTVLTLPLKSLRDFALKPGTPKIVDVPEAGALIKACQKEQGRFWNLRDIAALPLCAGELPAAALPSQMPRVRATVTGLAIAADEAVVLPRIVGDGRTIADAGAGVRLRVGQGALIAAAKGTRATVLWVQLAAIVPVVKDPRPVSGRE